MEDYFIKAIVGWYEAVEKSDNEAYVVRQKEEIEDLFSNYLFYSSPEERCSLYIDAVIKCEELRKKYKGKNISQLKDLKEYNKNAILEGLVKPNLSEAERRMSDSMIDNLMKEYSLSDNNEGKKQFGE